MFRGGQEEAFQRDPFKTIVALGVDASQEVRRPSDGGSEPREKVVRARALTS